MKYLTLSYKDFTKERILYRIKKNSEIVDDSIYDELVQLILRTLSNKIIKETEYTISFDRGINGLFIKMITIEFYENRK